MNTFQTKRRITKTRKDANGNITELGSTEAWSPRTVAQVVSDISVLGYVYFVNEAGYETVVQIVDGLNGRKFLRTTADKSSKNNLDNLPRL